MTTLTEAIDASIGVGDPALAGELVLLFEVDRYDLDAEATDTLRVATTDYTTAPTDTPADTPYYANLEAPLISQTILAGSDWRRSTGGGFSQVRLKNIDGLLDPELDTDRYDIKGREARIYGGLASWPRADFVELPGCFKRVVDFIRDEQFITFNLTDLLTRPDQLVLPNKYGGFGSAYDFDNAATCDWVNDYNLGRRDCSLEIRFKSAGSGGGTDVLLSKRNGVAAAAGNAGYTVLVDSSDQLRVYLDDGASFANVTIGSAAEFTDDTWHRLTLRLVRTTGDLYAYIDGALEVDEEDISAVSGQLSNTQELRIGSDSAGTGNFFTGELDEALVWYLDLDPDLQALLGTEFAVSGSETGLVGALQFDEHNGTDALNTILGPVTSGAAGVDGTKWAPAGNVCDPGSDSFTLTGWFRVASGAGGVVCGRRTDANATSAGYNVRVASSSAIFEVCDGSTLYQATVTIGTGIADDTFYGFGMVVDRTAETLTGYILPYQRGTLTASTATSITGAGSFGGGSVDFQFGSYDDNSGPLTGYIAWVGFIEQALDDEIEVGGFASALSAAISSTWVEGVEGSIGWFAARVLALDASSRFWSFTDNTGTTVTEHLNGDDATFNSAPTWIDRDATITAGGSSDWVATLEGDKELRGTPKPVALGSCWRIAPVLVSAATETYQYSDPAVAETNLVGSVWDGANLLDPDATPTPDYVVDTALNTITLNITPENEITAQVRGVVDGGFWLRFPGELMQFTLTDLLGLSLSRIDTDSFEEYDRLHPLTAGIYVEGDRTVESLYDEMLSPDGFIYRRLGDQLALGTRLSPADLDPEYLLEDYDLEVETLQGLAVPPPAWLVRMGIQKTHKIITGFTAGALGEYKRAHSREYLWVSKVLPNVREMYADAIERVYLVAYTNPAESLLLLERIGDLESYPWTGWEVDLTGHHWEIEIGDAVSIGSHSRYDFAGENGRNYICLGHSYGINEGKPFSRLQLWGGYDLPGGTCGEAPSLLQPSKIVRRYETRFEDNLAAAGTDITITGGGNFDVTAWADRGNAGVNLAATASRNPHWTPGHFGQGNVGGVDFSVLSSSNMGCELAAATTFNPRFAADRSILAFAMRRTSALGSFYPSRRDTSGGIAIEGGSNAVLIDGTGGGGCSGSFQSITSSGDNEVTLSQTISEPFVLIIEVARSTDSNKRWHAYFGNLSLFDSELVPIHDTSSPYFLDCTNVVMDGLGSPLDVTDGRTNFTLGAFIYYEDATPNSIGTGNDVEDPLLQNLWEYLRHYYLLGCP